MKIIFLSSSSAVSTQLVIPAKAGIQENTGFRVKPGMTICIRLMSSCMIIALFLLLRTPALAQQDTTFKKPHRSAFLAVSFSAVLPGGGQLYTQNCLKAAGFAGALGYLGNKWYRYDKDYMNSSDAETDYYYEKRRKYMLWTIGVWMGSLADAYVSAHLYKFNQNAEPRVTLVIDRNKLALAGRF
jgi:hypothetical protein